ncbi:MAG: signal peptidase II [Verrucomicrobia bacterium]|nr:signal peptidase II [Verrucomicrobiota bacterium]
MDLEVPDTSPVSPPAPSSAPALAPSWPDRVRSYLRLWSLALIVLALDQLTKAWIVARIDFADAPDAWPPTGSITLIDGFFYLVHVGNTGAAWSLFEGKSTLLALLAGITLAAIFIWRRHLGLKEPRVQLAFGLLCGGIVGNFIDRLRYNHVVDFLDFHFGAYIYPTFNIADAGICIGVVLYLYHSFREPASA